MVIIGPYRKDYFLHNNGIPSSFHKLLDVMEKR
jgi:hypothetical protein